MNNATAMRQSIAAFWNGRNARERSMLAAAIAVVVVGLIYALLIDPAVSGRADLEQRLPALRQQAAEVRALTREAGAAGTRSTAPVPAITRESMETSLARRGLKAQELTVNGELARLRLDGASFASLVEWLSEMQRSARLTVVDAKIEAGAQADSVNAALTLRQRRGDLQ